MEAKDKVMSRDECEEKSLDTIEEITLAQAEISFRAGEEKATKEVLEFIDWLDNGTRSSASWRFEVRKFRQAKLKEWRKK